MPTEKQQKDRLIYEGNHQPPLDPTPTDFDGRKYYPYVPSQELMEAVNLAIALKRPLLIEGEPGCGKTRLADALVYEFTKKYAEYLEGRQWWPYYIWNVKSSERARDGLYTFDAVARLRDAQLIGGNAVKYLPEPEVKEIIARLQDKNKYIEFGEFGKALAENFSARVRPILLIDEIDKADPDFANDLLLELDRKKFEIKETGASHSREGSDNEPIIIITSNRERPLPEPFLRRCLYFYLGLPKQDEELENIIRSRFGDLPEYPALTTATIARLRDIREILAEQPGSKLPGTSEILDLIEILIQTEEPQSLARLEKLAVDLPLLGIILKTQQDQQFYRDSEEAIDEES